MSALFTLISTGFYLGIVIDFTVPVNADTQATSVQ